MSLKTTCPRRQRFERTESDQALTAAEIEERFRPLELSGSENPLTNRSQQREGALAGLRVAAVTIVSEPARPVIAGRHYGFRQDGDSASWKLTYSLSQGATSSVAPGSSARWGCADWDHRLAAAMRASTLVVAVPLATARG